MPLKKPLYWLIILNMIILLVLPQLNTQHYEPLPEFFAETSFAWAAFSLFLITCFTFKEASIPRITIPLLLLGIFLWLQPHLVEIDFVGLSYVASLEMLLCIILAITINTLIKQLGLDTIITIICTSLVIGAILQSIIGFLQYSGLYRYCVSWIFYDSAHPTTNIFGHFGQRNHYCHYLSWATFGLIYLFHKHKIKLPVFLLITGWLIFSMTIASSRSIFMYFGLAGLISLIFYLKNRTIEAKNLFILIAATGITLVAVEYLYPLVSDLFIHKDRVSSGLQRMSAGLLSDGGMAGRRMVEWQKAWLVFKMDPIFGYGFNEYAKQSVYLQPLFPNAPLNSGLFTNCHNLILQMLAETGITGTLILVSGLIYSIYSIIKHNSVESVIILCMIFTTLSHSMVEYPLWYIYFLGPLIIFLSIDKPICIISTNALSGIVVIPLTAMIYFMFNGSFIFNSLVQANDPPVAAKYFINQAKYLENLTTNNVLWAYPALYSLDNYITVNDTNTNTVFTTDMQLQYENRFSYFHPYPDNMIKQAMLYWNIGNKEKARSFVRLALVSFPVYKDSYLGTLNANKKYAELSQIVKDYKYK